MPDLSNCNVMVVDDAEANVDVLVEALGDDYEVSVAMDGESALQDIAENPPDLILLDINMPGIDGYEVCERLKAKSATRSIPVIFLTAMSQDQDEAKGLELGAVDFVTKPFNPALVKSRVHNHLELKCHRDHLEDLVQAQVEEISNSQMATIFAMSKLAESRDDDTGKHLERVQMYCRLLAETMEKDKQFSGIIDDEYVEVIFQASPLHDIGKVAISDNILLKPGKLTEEEFNTMKTHTVCGSETLSIVAKQYPNNAFVNMGVEIARWHHEKWNGRGYPDGLAEDAIPLSARITAAADVYDALTMERCYKKAFSHEKAKDIIQSDSGTHFDPSVVAAFEQVEEEFNRVHEAMADA